MSMKETLRAFSDSEPQLQVIELTRQLQEARRDNKETLQAVRELSEQVKELAVAIQRAMTHSSSGGQQIEADQASTSAVLEQLSKATAGMDRLQDRLKENANWFSWSQLFIVLVLSMVPAGLMVIIFLPPTSPPPARETIDTTALADQVAARLKPVLIDAARSAKRK